MVDLNYILIWITGVSALSIFFTLREFPSQLTSSWKRASIFTLLVLALLGVWAFEWAGIIAAALWVIFVFSFRFGWNYVHPLAMEGQYQKASARAGLFSRIFPWAGYAQCAILYQLIAQKRHPVTTSSLEPGDLRSFYAVEAYIRLLAICNDWVRLRRAVEALGEEFVARYIPTASALYVRALQEDGRKESIVKGYQVTQFLANEAAENRKVQEGAKQGAPVTVGLGVLLLVFFGVQLSLGMAHSVEFLAMNPILVLEVGEWWRLLTCALIHADHVHLGTSLLGLWILGPMVERKLGGICYFILFFFSAIGASAFVCLLVLQGWFEPRYLLGASGAIMGLVGAELALALLSHRDAHSRGQLKRICLVLVLQSIFDLSTPQVSFAAHSGGVLSGFLFVMLLWLSHDRRRA